MTDSLRHFVSEELAADVPTDVKALARTLAEQMGGVAVLFYGSVLRTRALGDILDFYVLTDRPHGNMLRRLGLRWLWPDVSYHEIDLGRGVIRAKVATMPLATFESAATGALLDTTIWTRFTQPSALVWTASDDHRARTERAVADAAITATSFAAALGPEMGTTDDYWQALLRQTYRAELRFEQPGRSNQILAHAPERYRRLLPLAWRSAGIAFEQAGTTLAPMLEPKRRSALLKAWRVRALLGKPRNVARLIKAAFTFEGAARYGVWKIARHTGVQIELTPFRERHPVLAGPGVLWRVFRTIGR